MKRHLLLSSVVAALLSACVSAPNVDYSRVDPECGRVCQMNDASCTSRYAGMPIYLNTICNPQVEGCVKACPSAGAASVQPKASASKTSQSSTTDKLKELDSLYKSRAINKEEYENKRQEIIKAM
jgi:hypothetical protein